jgi:putative polyketide hydroxylase
MARVGECTMIECDRYPVLIVGAGAGGLCAATLLAHQGIQSLLVERRREIFVYPKARNLTFRSLEILRAVGLGPAVNASADHISKMVSKRTLNDAEVTPVLDADFFPSAEAVSPEPFGKYCPQSKLEPILLAESRRLGSDVRYGVELASLQQDNTGVVATIKNLDSGVSKVVHADYLIAADGTHSHIRRQLGIATSGFGQLPIFVVFIYFRGPWRQFVPGLDEGDVVQVNNADVNGIFLAVHGDLAVFVQTYFPSRGETVERFTPEWCRELILKAVGTPIDIEIVDIAPWQPYEQVADQFRCGRIFLVGDSAHTMPPFKGGGANTAIESAHNLAWKLAAVLTGTAGHELLDTYEVERRPVGLFAARQSLTGPGASFLELADGRPTLPTEEEQPFFYMIAGYKYRSRAVMIDEPSPVDADQVQLVDGEQLRGEPGTRLPHAWVQRDGERVSTLDLHGGGLLRLFTGAGGAAWVSAADAVSASEGVSIDVFRIGPEEAIQDLEGRWAQLTWLSPEAALLVRPDDFVGWRADKLPQSPADELRKVIRQIFGRS